MRLLQTREIVVATHNEGKVKEINHLIEPFGLIARSAKEHGLSEPIEDGDTFEKNAYTKAYAAASVTGLPALSDDSGLCVDALKGDPGVYTADWAEKADGSGRDFDMAMQKVEDALQKIGVTEFDKRTGRFVAVLCLCWPDGHAEYFRGEVEGNLVWPQRGEKGFGYDPVFQPQGYDVTFAQMTAEEKHGTPTSSNKASGQAAKSGQAGRPDLGLSHRSRAFAKLTAECLEPSGLKSSGLKPSGSNSMEAN
ncbi:MAG: non-canonical purine NTP pyrophosphatase [Rhizobiales bacterium]|nr:non-canonical purine NTP pyrophosphatase [Hyphomicrobiales bacterium]